MRPMLFVVMASLCYAVKAGTEPAPTQGLDVRETQGTRSNAL
jgi:hypothetical protein